MLVLDITHWDLFLRGAVAGVLALHLVLLALHGARPAARAALVIFILSVMAYLFCQRAEMLLNIPRPLAYAILTLCVGSTAWMWMAARALFDDGFRWSWPRLGAVACMIVLGLAGNVPYFPETKGPFLLPASGSLADALNGLHAAAMLAFMCAALWEVARGWQDDLVQARRAARRWVAIGLVLYAAIALVVELAVRHQPVGHWLPMLHVAGIGSISLALAVVVARRSLDDVLGVRSEPGRNIEAVGAPVMLHSAPAVPAPPPGKEARALAMLHEAMSTGHAYRRDGLTLSNLAQALGMGEAALRSLINQRLGYRNFNDFLHHHRLQEALERLAKEDLPILTIALECGYGSIGPFNRIFKARMRMTPSEYRARTRVSRGPTTN